MPNFVELANQWLASRMIESNIAISPSGFTPELNNFLNDLITKEAFMMFINDTIPDRFAFMNRGNMDVGAYVTSMAIEPATILDFPTLTDGGTVDQYTITKGDYKIFYHPTLVYSLSQMTLHTNDLRTSLSSGELGTYIGGKMQSLTNGVNSMRMRTALELISYLLNAVPTGSSMDIGTLAYPIDPATSIAFVRSIKGVIDSIEAIDSTEWNIAGHRALPNREDLILFVTAGVNSAFNSFASQVFNPDYLKLGVNSIVVVPDDWGGKRPMDAGNNMLYPIYDSSGRPTGSYSATQGGTVAVTVDHWDTPFADVGALLCDVNTFSRFNQTELMATSPFNAKGLYTNYFAHFADNWLYLPQKTSVKFTHTPRP